MIMKSCSVKFIPVDDEWAAVDKEDYELLSQFKWYKNNKGYAYCFPPKSYGVKRGMLMHRMIMNPGDGTVVDHVNRDPLCNIKENLRVCSRSDNQKNISKPQWKNERKPTSKYKGVYLHKITGRYKATIRSNNKQYHLGYFDTEIEAAMAYDEAAREKHGVFAALNFP